MSSGHLSSTDIGETGIKTKLHWFQPCVYDFFMFRFDWVKTKKNG